MRENQIRKVGPALEGISFERLRMRSDRFENLLNTRILPFLGLHAAVIGGLVAIEQNPGYAAGLGFVYLGVALLAIAHGIFGRQEGSVIFRPGMGSAASLTLLVAVSALPAGMGQIAGLLAVIWGLAVAAGMHRIRPTELLFPPIYIAFLALNEWYGSPDHPRAGIFVLTVMVAGFIPAIAVLFFRGESRHAVGLLLGSSILLLMLVEEGAGMVAVGVVVLLFILAAAVFYDVRNRSPRQSELRQFLGQVPIIVVLGVLTGLLSQSVWVWVLMVFAVEGALLIRDRRARGVKAVRLVWAFLALGIGILSTFEMGSFLAFEGWWPLLRMLIVPVALGVIATVCFSSAALTTARLFLVFVALLAYSHLLELVELLLGGTEPGGSRVILPGAMTLGGIVLMGFALAHFGQIVPGVAWWRGIVRSRHAVLVRKGWRSASGQVLSLPLVNGVAAACRGIYAALIFVRGSRERSWLADLMAVATPVFAALVTEQLWLLHRILSAPPADASAGSGVELPLDAVPDMTSFDWILVAPWLLWGSVAFLVGYGTRNLVLLYTAGVLILFPVIDAIGHLGDMDLADSSLLFVSSGLLLLLWGTILRSISLEVFRVGRRDNAVDSPEVVSRPTGPA